MFSQINQYAGKWSVLDGMAIFFARYFEYFLLFFLLLFLLGNLKKFWSMVLTAIVAAVASRFFITNIIRWIWFRPRPFIDNHVNLLFSYSSKASFPSGHAAFYFALAMVVFLWNRKAGAWFLVGAFLICLGRVFSGIHWPSDILAGAVIGVAVGWILDKISRKFLR